MNTSQLLQLQALKFKRQVIDDNPDFEHTDNTPAWMRDTYEVSGDTRNICAMIPLSLFQEIDRLSGVLSISKRRMIEMALRDMAISANKALDDVGFDASSMTSETMGDFPVDEE